MTTVSIYDIGKSNESNKNTYTKKYKNKFIKKKKENRYVGFSGSFSQVVSVFCEYGSVYVLAVKGEQLFQLTEKDTQSKLEILFKKNLYQMAIEYVF